MLGQLIGFIGSMFMTRLYTDVQIGIMTTVVSVSGMFASVINGRFDFAIVKERDDKHLFPLISLSLLVGLAFSVIVSFGSFFYFNSLKDSISPFAATGVVLLILLITAVTNVFKSYNNHVEDYKTMTSVIVIRRLAEELSMILFGFLSFKSAGLLISRIIGQFFGMRQQTRNIRKRFSEIFRVKKEEMKEAYSRHCRQLYFSAPAALMNSASYSLISLFIGKLFGLDVLGVYAISFAILGLPLSVISANVSKVYFGEASKEFAETGQFRTSTKSTLKLVSLVAVLMWVAMYFVVPLLVPYIYGKDFTEAGRYIMILSPMFAVRFVSSSLMTGLVVSNKQQFEMVIQAMFIVSVVVLSTLAKSFDINKYLLWITITYSAIYAFNLLVVYRCSKPRTQCNEG